MKTLYLFIYVLLGSYFSFGQEVESKLDSIVSSVYTENEPGISILVAKDGKVIYRKAFGKSNLELNTAMSPKNIIEIGSITKQFTAVSILMLEEQGKLNLNDNITKYISDYPTQGKTITIHHLLNHTSGLSNNTPASNQALSKTDMSPIELIDYFKNMPIDFEPGEKFRYSNSGYILLGYIIEVVSEQSYADFVEKRIFAKLNMTSSYYGSNDKIIKNRASGYKANNGDFLNADYLSSTVPYSAGSLMSSVDDLLKWQNAINTNKLINRTSLEKAINPSTLNNGKKIPYGYGWRMGYLNGSPVVAHNGGTYGFKSSGIFLPNENIYVIGLTNCNCSKIKDISVVTSKVAAMVIGKPILGIDNSISLSKDKLEKWVGAYQFEDQTIRYILLNQNDLYSLREGNGSQKHKIYPMKDDTFIFEDGKISYRFYKSSDGTNQVIMKSGSQKSIGKQIDKKAPEDRKSISVSLDILKRYIGKYQVRSNLFINVTIEESSTFIQVTGNPRMEIFAEQENQFFIKDSQAKIIFNKNDKGVVNSLTLNQGGKQVPARKIE